MFEQVIRPANFYFCIIAALQSIPQVSISGGTPTILLPLLFVFTVTAIKDALEDQVSYLLSHGNLQHLNVNNVNKIII